MGTGCRINFYLAIILFGAVVTTRELPAQARFEPILLADLNTTERSTERLEGVQSGSTFFFTKFTEQQGIELWRTDGTLGGTVLVRDIEPGPGSSDPTHFVAGRRGDGTQIVYFAATTTTQGRELWVSDGTEAGTVIVRDLNPGSASSSPEWLTPEAASPRLVFAATTPTLGRELWSSDGTALGTIPVVDANPGTADSNPSEVYVSGSTLLWSADNGTHGREPWGRLIRTVPAPPVTVVAPSMLRDVNPGLPGSNPAEFEVLFGLTGFAFAATSENEGRELWTTALDLSSTSLFRDLVPGKGSGNPFELRLTPSVGFTFFTLEFTTDFTPSEARLWVSDGTANGTVPVASFVQRVPVPVIHRRSRSAGTGRRGANSSAAVAGKFFFFVSNDALEPLFTFGLPGPAELWVSDGTAQGTREMVDLFPGGGGSPGIDILPLGGFFGTSFVAPMSNGISGVELWRSSGTAATTSLVADLNPGPQGSFDAPRFANRFLEPSGYGFIPGDNGFLGLARIGAERKIIFSDGTAANTRVIANASSPNATDSSAPYFATLVGSRVVFPATTSAFGSELFAVDPSGSNVSLLADLAPGESSGLPFGVFPFSDGSRALFSGHSLAEGRELWVTDGTSTGTQRVLDILPGASSSFAYPLGAELAGSQLVAAWTPTLGYELWRSDGTAAGTTLVSDIQPGPSSSDPVSAVRFGNQVLFRAETTQFGSELWVTDGTAGGTRMIVDLFAGSEGSQPSNLTVVGSAVLFSAKTAAGRELWRTDGTATGTSLVRDIQPGAGDSDPAWFTVFKNRLYFSANDGTVGFELWVSDGTGSGTQLVSDIAPGALSSSPATFSSIDNFLLFSADDGVNGRELWRSDGTSAGAALVKDLIPGSPAGLGFQTVAPIAGLNLGFFRSFNEERKIDQFYRTDGTTAGTVPVSETITKATPLLAIGGGLFFSGSQPAFGEELWRLVFDSCASDPGKVEPGVCGCGTADTDSNANGVIDCLAGTDFKAQLGALSVALSKLRPARSKAQDRKLRTARQAAAVVFKNAVAFAANNSARLTVTGSKTFAELFRVVQINARKALQLRKSSLVRDVRSARRSIGGLVKVLNG